jgi:hypothetical protein
MLRLSLALSLATASLVPVTSDAAPDTPLISGNVTVVGNIPELGAVGGHVRTVQTPAGAKQYFMMSGASGVSVYDISLPEVPVLAGRLALPHWSNEDVEVGGNLMLVSNDPQWMDAFRVTGPTVLGGIYILDISQLPLITFAYINPATGNRFTGAGDRYAGHTVTCVRTDCSYAIVNGVSEVAVIDLRTPSAPRVVTRFDSGVGSTHDAQVDETGLVWIAGSGGVIAYDFSNPANPRAIIGPHSGGLGYQHNTWRPHASDWTPGGGTSPAVRPGELLLVTEEIFYPPEQLLCQGQGRFQTRRLRDADALGSGSPTAMTVLDTWEPPVTVPNVGEPRAPVCSAHYFSESDSLVAIAWYQQGVRFLDVSNPRDIREVGYYINPSTAVFSTEWIGKDANGAEILYTMDPTRGIDILKFDRAAPSARAPELAPTVPAIATQPHPTFGYACQLAA